MKAKKQHAYFLDKKWSPSINGQLCGEYATREEALAALRASELEKEEADESRPCTFLR